ncbi:alpha-2-macroglobulin family protein [Abyssalbus ytuae]|uniref:MG2 domain-containing protein n=1 Tax=Abyssalbus ytuae TaxID=2926907 RepID=A0A9E6ZUK3_9FLAO|nr:MG2 domain-containing protein [Abyssalbus ytuae]UOB19203.1 MG2 domain-containing protein [Abyssalbus ytuae]
MKFQQFTFLIFAILLIVSCKKKTTEEEIKEQISNLYKYREYVTDVSPGIISAHSDIRVVLKNPVQGWTNNMDLPSDLVKITPNVSGRLIALDNQTVSFIPESPLQQDTEYNFTLELDEIIPDIPSDLKNFSFKVKTIKQQFHVATDNLQSYSKDWQYLEGTLRSSDKLNIETAKQLITAVQNDKKLQVRFDKNLKEGTQLTFKIDSIKRNIEDSEIKISWDGTPFNIDTKGESTLKIPGQNNFSVVEVNVFDGATQFIEINFSDPVKKNQNFEGLVVVEGTKKLKFSADRNVLKVYPDKEITGTALLEIFQGIQSAEGYKLKNIFRDNIAFEQLKPEVRMIQSGTILPSSNNLKINFEAVSLKAVEVRVVRIYENNVLQFLQRDNLNGSNELRRVGRPVAKKTLQLQSNISQNISKWKAYSLDLKEVITPEPGAIYRVEFSFNKKHSAYKCDNNNSEDNISSEEENFDEEIAESSYWNEAESYYEDGYYYGYDYDWEERDNPCHSSYYMNKKVGANVLASDLGITVKKGENNSYFVSVNNIVTTAPLPGTKVIFYNYQQQQIGEVITDEEGTSIFDSDIPAAFAIVERGTEKTYVKLNDGNVLSVSKFDVAGVKLKKGIKGFIYGERGVWRPGDTLFLSFMLNDNDNDLPANHPVKFELSDPYGKITHREVKTYGINNVYTFTVKTNENAPTGNWQAKVSVGGVTFSKSLKIETIKPNRLKIKAGFEGETLSGNQPVKGNLEVTWLHGAVAKNLKADVQAKFSEQKTGFPGFEDYIFDDPTRRFSSEEQTVFDGRINSEGKASFTLSPQINEKSPGLLKASFVTKVYENGGDFSTDVFSKTYSPYSTYVGLSTPKGDAARGMLLTEVKHNFDVVTLDDHGKPKAVKGLKVTVYKINWKWWWDTSEDNISTYNGSRYNENIFSTTINTNEQGKGNFQFELNYPEWGRYLVRVEDSNGGHATGKAIYIDWPGWAGKSRKEDPSAATMLVFSTDKKTYNVGETAVVTFPSSGEGRALVTIENGSEVLESLWVTPQKEETKFELPIRDIYTPNVYINITLLQPHANTANDLPIRLYGLVPVTVENPEKRLEPQINMPDVLRPEEKVKVAVSEKTGKAMTYTLAIVDEGLLDLTRFKTPSPWDHFNAREALGVKTWDIYDDVIGAYGGRIDQIFSIGGDDEAAGAKNKKANRFKPVVLYFGPFNLKEGETKTHEINIPKYVGSVRTMVVAGNSSIEAYGNAEKATPVRKPLMVLASLPRKITPGEKVTLPVTVFAMENKVKNVTLRLKENKAFRVAGETSQNVSFSQPDEKMAYFELEVADFTGIGKVEVEASGNGEKASYEVEIDVVNPNPVTTVVTDITLEPGSEQSINLETFGISGSNTAQIEFSTLPPMDFTSRLQYLIKYPHGCIEQTTSAAFPQLFLADIFDLTNDKKTQIQQNIKHAIKKLSNYQLPGGGFSYWSGQNYANDWGTSYAGHFLLEAEKKGYVLPIGFKSGWIQYQKTAAKQWRKSENTSDLAQAYRLYTLALAGNADVSSMNRLRETPYISNEAKHRLAAAYALTGQKSAAIEIFSAANIDHQPVKNDYYTYGSVERNRAMALETLILLDRKSEAQELSKTIAKTLSDKRWMSTQSTAYSLLAMAKFAKYIGGKGVNVSFALNGNAESISTALSLANRRLNIKEGNNSIVLKNNKDNTVFIRVLNSGILPVAQEKEEIRNLGVQVVYKGRDGSIMGVNQLGQGTDFIAEVTITNKKGEPVKNMALTQIIPSGWEIVNTRFTDFGDFVENDATYTDIRDDRINFYFDLKKYESKTFRVLLNASYLGTYYLPGIQVEAMYDNDYMARTKGRWIEVTQ